LRLDPVAAFSCALAVLCFAILPLRASANAGELRRWTEGGQFTFSLPNTTGANVALEAARGHVVLLHFFATWCESCREELPSLNRLEARANGKVTVLAIAVADADRSVRRLFAATPVDFVVLLDRDRAVAKAWGIATLPTTFVLGADLHPRLVVEADYTWDSVDPVTLTSASAFDAGGPIPINNASNR
jgi:thiol-disulfide isomerase/thioredoxin